MAKAKTAGQTTGARGTKAGKASTSAVVGFVLVLLSLLMAIAASVYLLVNHISLKVGSVMASWCDISSDVNCSGAIESEWSTLLGVPVPVWAIAFYTTLLLGVVRLGKPAKSPPREGWSLIGVALMLGTLYSFFLLYQLVAVIEILCPGCLVLDVANVVGLVGVFLVVGQPIGASLRWMFGNLKAVVLGPPGMLLALGFATVFLVGALVTRGKMAVIEESQEPIPPDRAYNIVEGYPDNFERIEIDGIDSAPVKGSPDAPVVIVEFSDFECPYCRRYAETLSALVDELPDLVQVRFMNYPLNSDCNPNLDSQGHAQACAAARAAVCAQDQGRFWELHDLMFANSRHLERDDILEMVGELRVDPDEFQACWDSDYSLDRVRSQAQAGFDGVRAAGGDRPGTPFSFVNGLLVRGARQPNQLEALVQQEGLPPDAEGTGETSEANPSP